MTDTTLILWVIGIYLGISLLTGILPALKVSGSVKGFVAGDRSMNAFLMYFVLGSSIFSSFAFLGGPGWAYSRGVAALYIIAYGVLGLVPLYFFGTKAWKLGKKYGYVTQAELLADRYNSPFLSVLVGLLSIVIFIPYLTLQIKGAGYVLEVVSQGSIPQWLGAAITYLIVLMYVYFSGVMGVGWSNAFQGMFMMAMAWFLGLWLPQKLYGGIEPMFQALMDEGYETMLSMPGLSASGEPWNWWAYSSAVFVSAVGFSMWPHFFMRAFAAKSIKSFRLSVVLYPSFLLFLIPILFIGFAAILKFPGVQPADTILPHVLMQLDMPALVIGLFCAGTLAASMSSGDAILHSAASVGVRDGLKPLLKRELNDQQERRWIRIGVLLIGCIAYYFAVFSEVAIVSLLLGAYGGVAQLFPAIFAMFYWPRATKVGAVSGIIAGLLVNTLFLLYPDLKPLPMHEGVYGLMVNVILLIGLSLLSLPESHNAYGRFLPNTKKIIH